MTLQADRKPGVLDLDLVQDSGDACICDRQRIIEAGGGPLVLGAMNGSTTRGAVRARYGGAWVKQPPKNLLSRISGSSYLRWVPPS